MYMQMYLCTCRCTYVHVDVPMYMQMYLYTCKMYICSCRCTYVHVRCTYVHMFMQLYLCTCKMQLCTCTYVHVDVPIPTFTNLDVRPFLVSFTSFTFDNADASSNSDESLRRRKLSTKPWMPSTGQQTTTSSYLKNYMQISYYGQWHFLSPSYNCMHWYSTFLVKHLCLGINMES